MEQEIVDYVLQAQKHGLSDFEIKQNLLNVGWEAQVVEENFVFAKAADNKNMATVRDTNQAPVQSPITPALSGGLPPISSTALNQPAPIKPSGGVLSDDHFQSGNKGNSMFKKPIVWATAAVLVLGGIGTFGYYTFASVNPTKIWNKFLISKAPTTYKTDFSFGYTDKSSQAVASSTTTSVTFGGSSANDLSDINNPKSSGSFKIALSSGSTDYNFSLNYLLLSKIFYIEVGKINELKLFLGDNIDWIKIDFDELQKYLKENKQDTSISISDQQKLKSDLLAIWSKANALKIGTSFSKENLNGVPVYHIKNQLDSKNLSDAIISSLQAMQKYQATSTIKSLSDNDKKVLSAIINKFQVKDFDVWIGQKDFLMYKFHFTTNAPTAKDLSDGSLYSLASPNSQSQFRDAKRLADVRQMASALELYFNEYDGYPASDGNGTAKDISPKYIGQYPAVLKPTDGTCTDYYNSYWYSAEGAPKTVNGAQVYPSYSLTFCLGSDTGGYKAGIAKLSPSGIQGGIPCPTTPEQCVGKPQDTTDENIKAINKLSFGADYNFDISFSDYGKPQTFTAPKDSKDVLDLIKGLAGSTQATSQSKSSDATRIYDMRQMASALELYFNDHNSYPDTLSQLAPLYIQTVPTAPTDSLGSCTVQENIYTYKKLSKGKDYNLTFCIAQTTGGYTAGKHVMSMAGIK